MANTRDSERIPTAGQVTGEVTVYEPMTILDLSDRGAQVETAFAFTSVRCTSSVSRLASVRSS